MFFLRRLYSLYALLVFVVVFILLLPLFMLIIPIKPLHRFTGSLNYLWGILFFGLIGMPVVRKMETKLDKRKAYVFCANHFSYLDIPSFAFTPVPYVFVGKSELSAIPLFGYMFKRLHIMVDRGNLRSRYQVIKRSQEAIDEGKSLVIFPEGGIITKNPPEMVKFKDGAFRSAIDKQIPIVPVTIPSNWIILPDDGRFLLNFAKMRVIYHSPIETKGMTLDDVEQLKNMTYQVIQKALWAYNPQAEEAQRTETQYEFNT
ncbi:lysophospholipid acyltransferase family protein [Cytophagales bacterium LB-30]|uniref:Lysophospholipid acyltransferase family protein n=1 Tax=Shiella aurantiaca TaxID=3058365 RepID=A0ABT8F8Y2_9BACT|nr:lysophospholipid acyltransferase family protein [Shiella aurantiaca]MDN4166905.1 lysophospholipid acyltransferase family protein [Shiella aurantiaca]